MVSSSKKGRTLMYSKVAVKPKQYEEGFFRRHKRALIALAVMLVVVAGVVGLVVAAPWKSSSGGSPNGGGPTGSTQNPNLVALYTSASFAGMSAGTAVTTWPDLSGNNHAATQSTPGNQFVLARPSTNAALAMYAGSHSVLMNVASIFPFNSDYTLIVALQTGDGGLNSGCGMISSTSNALTRLFYMNSGSGEYPTLRHQGTTYAQASASLGTTNPGTVSVVFNNAGQSASYYVNGNSAGGVNGVVANTDSSLELGGANICIGYYYAFAIFNASLSNSVRTQYENSFAALF